MLDDGCVCCHVVRCAFVVCGQSAVGAEAL